MSAVMSDLSDRRQPPEDPSDQDFSSGARWSRTTDLSIISAAL
jgi:hypothetical protein